MVRMLEMDWLSEVFWLMFHQETLVPPVVTQPLLDCFGVRVHTGPGDCKYQQVALMKRPSMELKSSFLHPGPAPKARLK